MKRPSGEGDTSRRWPPVWFSYIENKSLEETFDRKKHEFSIDLEMLLEKSPNAGKRTSTNEVLLFHGTSSANTDGICRTNFNLDMSVRFVHGRGIYLSEYPTKSLQYGEALLVCKVLLGREQEPSSSRLQKGYDSLKIKSDPDSYIAGTYVIRSVEQILPYFVISAEYPEAIKIGRLRMTTLQRSRRRRRQRVKKLKKFGRRIGRGIRRIGKRIRGWLRGIRSFFHEQRAAVIAVPVAARILYKVCHK